VEVLMEKTRVLVVEDDPSVRRVLESHLGSIGCEVCGTASSGGMAIELAGDLRPDLVLMDIVLSGHMDGIEASEVIRGKFEIPVAFISAFADDEKVSRAGETVPYGYLVKPFRKDDIRAVVETALAVAESYRREKALDRMRTIGEMAGAFAHQVRNPLQVVLGMSELMMRSEKERDWRKDSRVIHEAALRIHDLSSDLLNLSRVGQPNSMEEVSAFELCEEAVKECKSVYPNRKILVRDDRSVEGDGALVRINRGQVLQALVNLIQNSVQHSSEETPVLVSVSTGRTDVILKVIDYGTGIPRENIEKVLEPFFTTREGGSGLGLNIAKKFVEDSGGTFLIRSFSKGESHAGSPSSCHVRIRFPKHEPE